MRLNEKVAIVTGGAKGIGRAIAEAFVREGATIVLADRDEAALDATAKELSAHHREVIPHVIDVTSEEGAALLAQTVRDRFERIDVLVNSAGITGIDQTKQLAVRVGGKAIPSVAIAAMDISTFEQILKVNLTGTVIMCKAVLPAMISQGRGRIINIASIAGKRGYPLMGAYCASKSGVIAVTEVLAGEVGAFGITVNAICPGWTDTDMTREAGPLLAKALGLGAYERLLQILTGQQKIPGLLKPEDIAPTAVFLASDESATITGQSLNVDRGAEVR